MFEKHQTHYSPRHTINLWALVRFSGLINVWGNLVTFEKTHLAEYGPWQGLGPREGTQFRARALGQGIHLGKGRLGQVRLDL